MTTACRLFAVLLIWALAAFASTAPAGAFAPHVLRFTEGLDVATLDPFLATTGVVIDLSGLTMAYLVRYDAQRHPTPELLTELPTRRNGGISPDGRTITYHLRRGVRWSDGAPFDADDVAYTLRVIADKSNRFSQRDAWDRVVSFKEPDKFTIVFHLDRPYALFIGSYFASSTFGCILPAHVLGTGTNINEAPYNALPVGIGPFRYTSFRRGDEIEMEANPYYFGRKPRLQKVVYELVSDQNTIFTQLQTGELDLWASIGGTFAERAEQLQDIRSERVQTTYMGGIFLQTERPPLREAIVRRALRLATNRPYVFDVIFRRLGVLAESVVGPPSLDFVELPRAPFDVAIANKLLDDDGWVRLPDGVRAKAGQRLSLTLAFPTGYPQIAQLAELLRTSWAAIGVAVTTKPAPSSLFYATANEGGIVETGNFDAALLSQASGVYADVENSFGCRYRAPQGLNATRYCRPEVDRELAAYTTSYDLRERAALARRFQQHIDDDVPVIILYARALVYAHTAHLTGFRPQTFGVFDAIADADMN